MAEKIGQILIRKGKITPARLRDALRTQQFFGGYLGSHLINLGFIDEATLGETLSEIYRVPFAPYESIRLASPEAIRTLPSSLAQRFRVIPIQVEAGRLHLAMLNPRDATALKEITAATSLTIAPWVAPEFRIVHALDKHYKIRRERTISVRTGAHDGASSSGAPSAGAYEAPSWDGTERRQDPRPGREIGMDGHPIDAAVLPDLGGTVRSTADVEWVPRSLQEWREGDEAAADAPHPSAAQGAPHPQKPGARARSDAALHGGAMRRGGISKKEHSAPLEPSSSLREEAREAVREHTRVDSSPAPSHPSHGTVRTVPAGAAKPGAGPGRDVSLSPAARAGAAPAARTERVTTVAETQIAGDPEAASMIASEHDAGSSRASMPSPRDPHSSGPPRSSPHDPASDGGAITSPRDQAASVSESSHHPAAAPAAIIPPRDPAAASVPIGSRTATSPPAPGPAAPPPAAARGRAGAISPTSRPQDARAPEDAPGSETTANMDHALDPDHESLLAGVSAAANRDDLIASSVDVLSKRFRRVVAFVVKNTEARALVASPDLDAQRLAERAVPLDRPSIISSAQSFSTVHVTQPSGSDDTRAFHDAMGGPAQSALVVPVALRDRLVLVFYADNADAPIGALDLALWKRLARICTISLEIFILKNRMRRL